MEPQYRCGSKRVRPFARSARVSARGCSRLLHKAVTDFGADVPYARVIDKLVEHYGIVVGESTIRKITLRHGQEMHRRSQGFPQGLPAKVPDAAAFIAEVDGSMVPTVRSTGAGPDRRKGKSVQWQEVKLSLAHAQGSKQRVYAATLQGDVNTVGKQLRACAKRAGLGPRHRVHGVGDGAPWIAQQMKKRFGGQGSYLLDFYHVCDYLGAAARAIEDQPAAQQHWLEEQKQHLKTQRQGAVLAALQSHLEPAQTAEEDAPVRKCWRYLSQRPEQLDYEAAIRQDLPIGSGEIESAHRYIIQKRLKVPGAWWKEANVEHMLALRLNRANEEWDSYWATDYRYAA